MFVRSLIIKWLRLSLVMVRRQVICWHSTSPKSNSKVVSTDKHSVTSHGKSHKKLPATCQTDVCLISQQVRLCKLGFLSTQQELVCLILSYDVCMLGPKIRLSANQVRSRVLCTFKSGQCLSLGFPPAALLDCSWSHVNLFFFRCRRVRGLHRGASACRAPAGATPERGPGHGFWGREADMADRKGQGHPLPEGAAGQLLRHVSPQWSAGEGTAPAEGRQRARRRRRRRCRRRRRKQKWVTGKRSARAEEWEWKARGQTFLRFAVDRENWIFWNLNVTHLQCKLCSPCSLVSMEAHICKEKKEKK